MAQEFAINSSSIENKINQLLPSQGGFGAGVDFSASTMVIPIVDLTESAEGSGQRADLQSALSLGSITAYSIANTTSTIVNTTGYFRVFGTLVSSSNDVARFSLTDGTTTKIINKFGYTIGTGSINYSYDFIVFLPAGVSLTGTSGSTNQVLSGNTRQLADVNGNLVSPL